MSKKKPTEAEKKDYEKYFLPKGDIGFSPKRNKMVVDGTIRKYEQMRVKKNREFEDNIRERADAVATYLKHLVTGKSTPAEKYFGRRELARLRGQKILAKLRGVSKTGDPLYELSDVS